jgi:multidrug efflux pump subunit AcrA (membrane-fusion protein)
VRVSRLRSLRWIGIGLAVVSLVAAGRAYVGRATVPEADTVVVTRGEYADIVEIRGQLQPVRSIYVTAPYNAGELQILKIAANGTPVTQGDVVAEFDAVALRRTIQEKQSELRSATAELRQAGRSNASPSRSVRARSSARSSTSQATLDGRVGWCRSSTRNRRCAGRRRQRLRELGRPPRPR